jgi:hypothetical protein
VGEAGEAAVVQEAAGVAALGAGPEEAGVEQGEAAALALVRRHSGTGWSKCPTRSGACHPGWGLGSARECTSTKPEGERERGRETWIDVMSTHTLCRAVCQNRSCLYAANSQVCTLHHQ